MIRDEIAAKVFQCIVMDRHADEIADAILPIVERVAQRCVMMGYEAGMADKRAPDAAYSGESFADIVRMVMGNE